VGWQDVTLASTVILYALAFYNCYHILNAKMSPASSIAWIFFNLALPFFGVPLYLLLGRFRIDDYKSFEPGAPIEFFRSFEHLKNRADANPESENLKIFRDAFARFGAVFNPHPNDKVVLLVDGEETFASIFSSIEKAQSYILVQYYILRSDKLGIELKELLIRKAEEGIKVFLLYDDMGSFWLSRKYIDDLKGAGIRVARFLPVTSLRRFFLLNFRNHRKLVVVDGLCSFTGGLNVGEEYVGSRFNRKEKWRDTHLKIIGPATCQLEEVFFADWFYATDQNLKGELEYSLPKRNSLLETDQSRLPSQPLPMVQIVPSGPNDTYYIGMLLFKLLILTAKKRLWIATPYFIPDENLQRDLELAVMRGVDVRIMIPRESDNRVVHWVSLSYAEQMERHGILIYLYDDGFSHQKLVCVDDDLCGVGTSNFDNRALYLNFEMTVLVFDPVFNRQVRTMLERDFSLSRPLEPRRDHLLRRIFSLRANGARLLAPLM
jgi:cardiolipin synthase